MTVMLTRRVLRRTHLLRPDAELNNLYLYVLAVISARFAILVHSASLMSDHEHLTLTDAQGLLPCFTREFHRLVALGIKCLRQWDGAVWDHEKPSVVELRTPQAVLEKIAYCIANPVAAGLVKKANQWPGINTRPEDLGRRSITVKRPDFFFDQNNPQWPATATLELTMPPNLDRSDTDAREAIADEVTRLEELAKADLSARGAHVLGPDHVTAVSPYERATSKQPRRGRNPTFAVGRGQAQALFDAVTLLRAFRRAYRAALERWRSGVRNVLFPAGTWWMHKCHGASVASP
jgi:putative transposase